MRLALAGHANIDELDRETAVLQMLSEAVADADAIHAHRRQPAPKPVEQVDRQAAGILSAPGGHRDDPPTFAAAFTDVDNRFRLAGADIDAGDQRACSVIDYWVMRGTLEPTFEPGELDQRALRLVRKAREYPR
jgi:hypothetical protein